MVCLRPFLQDAGDVHQDDVMLLSPGLARPETQWIPWLRKPTGGSDMSGFPSWGG